MDQPEKHLKHNHGSMIPSCCSNSSFSFFDRIPKDLEFKILIRLPVKSLMQCKCVCKEWLSTIKSPDFVSQHANRVHNPEDDNLIIMHDIPDHGFTLVPSFKPAVFKPEEDAAEVEYRYLPSSFDGIVCVIFSKMVGDANVHDVSLWNPAMKQSIFLPPSPECDIYESDNLETICYGFGLDLKTYDYKLVKLVVDDHELYKQPLPLKSQVVVYCLKTDAWKVIGDVVPHNFRVISNPKMPFQKGIYCWLGYDQTNKENYFILSFDFSKESFGIIQVPEFKKKTGLNATLTFLKDKITFINRVNDADSDDYKYTIWVLGDYNVAESWAKVYTLTLNQIHRPLGFSVDGKLILVNEESYNPEAHTLLIYDPLTQDSNVIGTPVAVCNVAVYKESMISVKSAMTIKKRATHERLLKALNEYQVFGTAIPAPPLGADSSFLQREKSRLQALVQDQEKTIKELREGLSELKDELSRMDGLYTNLYNHYVETLGLPPTSFPVPHSSGGYAGTSGSSLQ